jgi:hypothetical protein
MARERYGMGGQMMSRVRAVKLSRSPGFIVHILRFVYNKVCSSLASLLQMECLFSLG